jgi:hypothetical protein
MNRETKEKKTRLFFATDVHGSEPTFKKFVNAGKVYGVPAWRLVGSKYRDRIRIYCDTTSSRDAKVYAERFKQRKAQASPSSRWIWAPRWWPGPGPTPQAIRTRADGSPQATPEDPGPA